MRGNVDDDNDVDVVGDEDNVVGGVDFVVLMLEGAPVNDADVVPNDVNVDVSVEVVDVVGVLVCSFVSVAFSLAGFCFVPQDFVSPQQSCFPSGRFLSDRSVFDS